MASLIVQKQIQLPLPGPDDRRAYDERITQTFGLVPLTIPLSVLNTAASLLKNGLSLSCIAGRLENGYKLIAIGPRRSYSLALDLGTTNLVLLLYDNITQAPVTTLRLENPQIEYGSDILTRLQNAMTAAVSGKVSGSLRKGVNRAIGTICERAGIAVSEVHALVVAGNTVMTHFFLDLDVSTIPVDPFVPLVRTPGFQRAADLALEIHPEALVYAFPNAGSYVGGDIIAGILACGIERAEQPEALIDVGTNAEVVIGNRDWILVGAGAAGPALEEGITRIGRRASTGIIYDVEISEGRATCRTFDEKEPQGICGSGMVSLLFALFNAGIVDRSGMLDLKQAGVRMVGQEPGYVIDCGRGEPLIIRQSEIQNFMKSKAAMFTLLLVLTRSLGISFSDIARVYVSGALGSGIDPAKAAGIGMLPAWPPAAVSAAGNTSLEGGRMLLANADLLDTINSITRRITYKHMHDDPEFMKEFLGAVFIPHTNPELLKGE